MSKIQLLFLLAVAAITWSQTRQQDLCSSPELNECDKCLAHSSDCVWCPTPQVTTDGSVPTYCRNWIHGNHCSSEVMGLPLARINITREDELNSGTIYVSPQNVNIRLRKGESMTFEMRFQLFSDIPTDFYFLFDGSAAMSRILDTLKNNIVDVESAIRSMSSSYRLGTGAFQDKPTLPYAVTNNMRYIDPDDPSLGLECLPGFGEGRCNPAYGFQHQLSLSDNATELQNAIDATTTSTNLDTLEGGLEALLQAAICSEVIGWRTNALHLLLLFTDHGYHIAGDGRLAGLVKPNDGECHLVRSNEDTQLYEYTHSLEQDYPSIKQVEDVLSGAGISPVFLIRGLDDRIENFLEHYDALAREMSSVRAQAFHYSRDNERNIDTFIDILDNISTDLLQSVYVQPPAVDGFSFQIEPTSGCNRRDSSGACLLNFGDEVTFNVTVTLDDCKTSAKNQSVQLSSLPYLFTTIQLEALCECYHSTQSH